MVVSPSDKAICNFLSLLIVAESSISNVAEFLDVPLQTSPYTKTTPVLCENQSFFSLFRKSLHFPLFLFAVWWSIFDQPFRRLLPLSCFYGSSQWLFKVKITCKRINFIKKLNQIQLCMSLIIFVIAVFYFDQSSTQLLIVS